MRNAWSWLTGVVGFVLSSNLFAIQLQPVIEGGIIQPVYVAQAPGESSRHYIIEQRGRIQILENDALLKTPFLNIQSKVVSGGELGLLSVAFHPNFATNRRFFVNYTTETPRLSTVVSEFQVGSTVEKEIIRINQPYRNHNGGQLQFGPDGFLYIGMGDGGDAGDPGNRAQNVNDLLGKMLRVDIDHGSPYAIPPTNPFAQSGGRAEIFAWGLRNPWRFSFDRSNGRLITGDVGQNRLEEIDIVELGKNYGWRLMEGKLCYNPSSGCNPQKLALPIHEYGRTEGASITGGYIYRGKLNPELQGHYIYGDYVTGNLWALKIDESAQPAGNALLLKTELPISSFGEELDGEVLLVSHDGSIFRLVPNSLVVGKKNDQIRKGIENKTVPVG